jgi:microcystin-dependent protein
MANPFVAEIRIVPFNFAPLGWALCDGQLLPITQNTALFSLLGTFYGGDGRSTFALPNLQNSTPLGQGQGPGLSDRFIGETGGVQAVTLIPSELPAHTHTLQGATGGGISAPSGSELWGAVGRGRPGPYATATNVSMSAAGTTVAGGGAPHNNMPPYLTLNFIIALQGVYPARS